MHFDLVVKYSHGDVPAHMEAGSGKRPVLWAVYSAPVYRDSGTADARTATAAMAAAVPTNRIIERQKNPIINPRSRHYIMRWLVPVWRLGDALDWMAGKLLYWLRFLNIPFVIILVWLGWLAARLVFPADISAAGCSGIIGVFSTKRVLFHSKRCSVAYLFRPAFICLIRLCGWTFRPSGWASSPDWRSPPRFWSSRATCRCCWRIGDGRCSGSWQLFQAGEIVVALPMLASVAVCAILPAGALDVLVQKYFGSLTGSELKIRQPGLDTQTFRRMVASSHFHRLRFLGFYPAAGGDILAGRNCLASPAARLPRHQRHLHRAVFQFPRPRGGTVLLPAASRCDPAATSGAWLGLFVAPLSWRFLAFLSIIYDFHDCRLSVTRTSVFHLGPIDARRVDSVSAAVRLSDSIGSGLGSRSISGLRSARAGRVDLFHARWLRSSRLAGFLRRIQLVSHVKL